MNRIRLEDPDEGLNNILASNGNSKTPHDFNILEYFYNTYKSHPYIYAIESNSMYYNWNKIKEELNEKFSSSIEVLNVNYISNIDNDSTYENVYIAEISTGVVVIVRCIDSEAIYYDDLILETDDILVNDIQILSNGEIDKAVQKKLYSIMKKSTVKEIDNVSIGMVSMADGEYYVKDFDITKGVIELNDLDLHYGKGFTKFNEQLLDRMLVESKGLVLFHGDPGSGKCVRGNTKIKIRNKETNKVEYININELL